MSELVEHLVTLAKRMRKGKASPALLLAAVSTSVAVTLALSGAAQDRGVAKDPTLPISSSPTLDTSTMTRPGARPSTEIVGPVEIGGLDIAGYCGGLHFSAQTVDSAEVYCQSPVDLLLACKREKAITVRVEQKADDPNSATCRDATGKDLGGITDMLGYCRDANNSVWANRMTASAQPDKEWYCRVLVNVSAACAGQFNDPSVTALWTKGSWRCYRPQ